MKIKIQTGLLIISLLIVAGSFQNCRDKVYEELKYTANVPLYMGFAEFRSAVKRSSPKSLEQPGKIYIKGNFLFINENQAGVHVIDNSNPAAPASVAFIEIPGNVDIAIKDHILYADSYIDLVAIDISNPNEPVEVDRIENAFPNVLPPMDINMPVYGLDFSKGVVVGWETKDVVEIVEKGTGFRGWKMEFDATGIPTLGSSEVLMSGGSVGVGGSMARFTLTNNFMYAVHNDQLKVFNVSSTPGISTGNAISLNRLVETIFPYDGKLFLGTTTGMLVYGLNNPASPEFISSFDHINACDPVVVSGNTAYVTLRAGNACFGAVNQLDVIDISSIENPFLIKSYPFFNPHGLGIDGTTLFICDGDAGLKVYDATDPMEIHQNQLAHFEDIRAYDVIPLGDVLILIGADGLFQYDYSDLDNMHLISSIDIIKP